MNRLENLRTGARISLVLLGILLAGSIVFWKERMLFIDDAFIAFDFIQTKNFSIPLNRYGAFVSQLLPLLALKFNASLKTILILYSVNFNLFFLAAAVLLYRFRLYGLIILLGLYFTLYVSDSYYWTNNEKGQGATWLFLNFGMLIFLFRKYGGDLKKFVPLSLLFFIPLTVLSIYTHPLVMVLFVFMWGFFVLKKERFFVSKISVYYALAGLAVCVVKYIASTKNGYDPGIMNNVTGAHPDQALKIFKSPLADDFWHTGITNYWWLWIVFFMGCFSLLRKKNYWLLAYVVMSCIGYFILIGLAFGSMPRFHIESEWVPLSVLGSIAFVYYTLPHIKTPLAIGLLCALFATRLAYIVIAAPKFTHRIEAMQRDLKKMQEMNITKLALTDENNEGEKDWILTWALPCETMLLSSLEDTVNRTMIILSDNRKNELNPEQIRRDFINPFYVMPVSSLNFHYFSLDTTEPYTLSTWAEFHR